jgi:GTPase SAR1 family protein
MLKDDILTLNQQLVALFHSAKSTPGLSESDFSDWEKTCTGLERQLGEDTIRVAVVGAIKSGKSTFINSMFGGDYVKRGAGVVTSIVTRMRTGRHLKARLDFKSWEEVNAEIEQAMALLPTLSREDHFDIRRTSDRAELLQALGRLRTDQWIANDARDLTTVLLASYLKGYDAVVAALSDGARIVEYGKERFFEHWKFAGDENLAVYLRDVSLDIDSSILDSGVEIADCQGSDSPNPLHLAMIQDYLLVAHLLLYVISSRTGLRRADIRFLSMIKKMGILDNTMFILNCDFNEHESLEDLRHLESRVCEELALIKPSPEIYTFSALFNLFQQQAERLTDKDKFRLQQWEADTKLVENSRNQRDRFESEFQRKLSRKRHALLWNNHLERLGVIVAGLQNWIHINQDILARDAASVQVVLSKVKDHRERLQQVKQIIQSTLEGAKNKIKQELQREMNRFLDERSGEVMEQINSFVSGFRLSPDQYGSDLEKYGFSKALYRVFQELRQSLDRFITEVINPDVLRFIVAKEEQIRSRLAALSAPFDAMVQDALSDYAGLMNDLGINLNRINQTRANLPDRESVLRFAGLTRPPIGAAMKYSARVQTEAVMRFGFYKLLGHLKRLLRKPPQKSGRNAELALASGLERMKQETLAAVAYHLKDYRENLKFNYFFKLVEAAADVFTQAVHEHLQAYATDLSAVNGRMTSNRIDKDKAAQVLMNMDLRSREIQTQVARIKEHLESF